MTRSFIKQALSLTALTLCTHAAHAVVEAGHWDTRQATADFGNALGINLAAAIDQTAAGDFTYVFMNVAQGQLTSQGFSADEGADVFVVQAGDILSNAAIAKQAPPFVTGPSIAIWPAGTISVGQDFYLGTRTRSFTDPGFDFQNTFTSFGWAHFQVDAAGVPQLVASAMAFKEGGIVVGTLQAVPEPSTFMLAGLGLIGLAGLTRRHRQNPGRGPAP